MLSAKQGGIKYYFLSLWYDSTWDWTPVSRMIGEHSNNQFYFKQFSLAWLLILIVKKHFLFQAIQLIQTVLIQSIQFSIRIDFVYAQLNVKTVLY